jgi:hypothetical protein
MALKFAVNNSLSAITTLPSSISGGALNLISTQTASASASIEFTSGIDSTYDSYVFKFINIHPATDSVSFDFNFSIDSGSNYNVTKTTTFFRAYLRENDTSPTLEYSTSRDLAQSTSDQTLSSTLDNKSDSSLSGKLQIFNPSSDTFVKHFISDVNDIGTGGSDDYSVHSFSAGYGNTTSPINAVRFQMSSGNIDDGIIKMYGVS